MKKQLVKRKKKPIKAQQGATLSTYLGQMGNISDFTNYANSLTANNKFMMSLLGNQIPGLATPEQMQSKYKNAFTTNPANSTLDSSTLKQVGNTATGFISSLDKSGGATSALKGIMGATNGSGGGGLTSFLNKGIGGGMSVAGGINSALSIADQFIPQAEDKASKITSGVFNGLSKVAGFIPGVGTVASVALKGLGTLFGAGVKNVEGNAARDTVDSSASYTGADALDSKRFGIAGLGAAKRYQKKVDKREQERLTATDILNKGKDDLLASTNVQQMQLADNLKKNASDWMYNIRAGEFGMKIKEAQRLSKQYRNRRPATTGEPAKAGTTETPQFLKDGGTINVIPEGALHARKHHLEELNPELEGITKKGIPVISQGEGGEVIQQAEVEKSEIIFRLEVTNKLEELRKRYKETDSQEEKDTIAIEAGKLLTQEIMENTKDNTGELLG